MSDYRKILEQVRDGEVSVEEALLAIKKKPFEDIGYAKVDRKSTRLNSSHQQ